MSISATRIEFDLEDLDDVLDAMARFTEHHNGWINLQPNIDPADAPPAPSLIAQLFRSSAPDIALATWTPPTAKRPDGPQTIGVQHRLGNRLIPILDDLGVARHEGWRRIQDSPRRGLVAEIPADVAHQLVLEWLMHITVAVTAAPSTGSWIAAVIPSR